MIHWSIKLGRSCSITFHFTFYTYYYAHLMFRILKKNPLTILICLLSSVFQDQELVLFLLGVSYTPAPPNQFFFMMYYSGVGLEPARNTIDGRNVALNFFRKKRLTKHFFKL